jgi:hypothetical protein
VAGISMDLGMTLLVYNLMRTLLGAEQPQVEARPAAAVQPLAGAA